MSTIIIVFEAILSYKIAESTIFIVIPSVFARDNRCNHYNYSAFCDFGWFLIVFSDLKNRPWKIGANFRKRPGALYIGVSPPWTPDSFKIRVRERVKKHEFSGRSRVLESAQTTIFVALGHFFEIRDLVLPRAKKAPKLTPMRPWFETDVIAEKRPSASNIVVWAFSSRQKVFFLYWKSSFRKRKKQFSES